MQSKIRVEFDFDKKEPYIQIYLEAYEADTPDMRDLMLRNFIQSAEYGTMYITYPETNKDNSCPQIRFTEGLRAVAEQNTLTK